MFSWGTRSLGESEVKESQTRNDLWTLASPFWPPSITSPLSPGVSSLLGDGCLLSFFFSIREDDSNTALGHQNIHKLVPIPANEEGKPGDGQAVSRGFGLGEAERRQQLGPPLTPHSSEAQGLLPRACASGFSKKFFCSQPMNEQISLQPLFLFSVHTLSHIRSSSVVERLGINPLGLQRYYFPSQLVYIELWDLG